MRGKQSEEGNNIPDVCYDDICRKFSGMAELFINFINCGTGRDFAAGSRRRTSENGEQKERI